MRKIVKGVEPKEWTAYRLTPGARYQAKPELREALLKEQGYLCAYCMRRIPVHDKNSNESTRIEHIRCRNHYPQLELDYNNMVVCCPGAINDDFHCDKLKDDKDISFTPFDEHFISTLSYATGTGEIRSGNNLWNQEINKVLNLNNRQLMSNRKAVIDGVCKVFPDKNPKAFVLKQLKKWSEKDAQGKYLEYSGVVIWFLNRWLKHHK